MTHVQIDDGFFDHPKVLSVSKDAKLLSVAAICYCGNMLTDGFIPFGAVAVLAAKTGVAKPKVAVDELLAAHLWDDAEGGYNAHDYLDYNTPAEKVKSERAAAKERMRALRSGNVRANKERTNEDVRANFGRSSENVRDSTTETTTTSSIEPIGSSELKTPVAPIDEKPLDVQPWDLLDALCSEIGADASVLSKSDKGRQLVVAKRLVENDATVDEIRRITRWALGQNWLTGGIDLLVIEKQIGKWRMNGRPLGPPGAVDPDEALRAWKLNGAEAPSAVRPFSRGAAS